MTKKLIFLIVVFTLIQPSKLHAQINRDAVIAGDIIKEYDYLSNWHIQNNKELKCLDSPVYKFFVSLKVDTSGNIIDLIISEIRICKLPTILREYITKLFKSADGKWLPQLRDGHKVISNEMIWLITVEYADQTLLERAKAFDRLVGYYDDTVNKYYNASNKRKFLALNYYRQCK